MAGSRNNKEKTSLASITIPAIVGAISTIAAAYFSYSAGVNAVQIPINYTQTAEAKQPPSVQTVVVTQPAQVVTITQIVPVTPKNSPPIAIDSQKAWQSTGVSVNKGDTVNISVVGGTWTPNRRLLSDAEKATLPDDIKQNNLFVNLFRETDGTGSIVTSTGDSNTCTRMNLGGCPMPEEGIGKLIARIGLGEPFAIGNQSIFVVGSSGIISLRMNYPDLKTSSGVLAVLIEVSP